MKISLKKGKIAISPDDVKAIEALDKLIISYERMLNTGTKAIGEACDKLNTTILRLEDACIKLIKVSGKLIVLCLILQIVMRLIECL